MIHSIETYGPPKTENLGEALRLLTSVRSLTLHSPPKLATIIPPSLRSLRLYIRETDDFVPQFLGLSSLTELGASSAAVAMTLAANCSSSLTSLEMTVRTDTDFEVTLPRLSSLRLGALDTARTSSSRIMEFISRHAHQLTSISLCSDFDFAALAAPSFPKLK